MATPGPLVSDQSSKNVENMCQVEALHQEQPNLNFPKSIAKKRVVGFDCEFVERPPRAFQVDCPVCLLIVREPHQVTCCGYNYCQSCIDRVGSDKKPCPMCNKTEFSVFPNKGLQRAIYEYQVLCGHQKLGCKWVGELRELDEHLNESPILGRQFSGCEFAEIECNDCGKSLQRQLFKAHQLEQHPFNCEHCHNYESYYEDVVRNHWPVCGFRPVPCPNECGVYPERQNLEHHVTKDCPLTVVNCKFHYAGCEVQLPRKDMPVHLAENLVAHMAQLATYNQKKVQEKDQQIAQLTKDLRKEVEVNRQKIDRLERENEALSKSLLDKKEEIAQLREELHVKDKATTEVMSDLQESSHVKEEMMRQEIVQLRQKQDKSERDLIELARKQDVSVSRGENSNQVLKREIKDTLTTVAEEVSKLKEDARTKEETLQQESESFKQKMSELRQAMSDVHKREETKRLETDELARKYEDVMSKGQAASLKEEIARLQEYLHEKHEAMRREIGELKQKNKEVKLESADPNTLPVDFTMTEFEKHKQGDDIWYSEPFYTHHHGYKMCLKVYANGREEGKGTHVSLGACLMRGDFDNFLKWPFRGDITVGMLNQLNKDNNQFCAISYSSIKRSQINQRVQDEEHPLHGKFKDKFLSHDQLTHDPVKRRQFLKDNCLRFRVNQVRFLDVFGRVATLEENHLVIERQCLSLESRVCMPPFDFTMRDFEQQKANNDTWYSPSFYTHPRGYRMRIRVVANGMNTGRGTCVTVAVFLMRGEWDNYLKWPFRGEVTIQLLNQIEDKGHHKRTLDFADDTTDRHTARVTVGERAAAGWGEFQFISHRELNYDKNCQYLKYDSLHFQITEVKLNV